MGKTGGKQGGGRLHLLAFEKTEQNQTQRCRKVWIVLLCLLLIAVNSNAYEDVQGENCRRVKK